MRSFFHHNDHAELRADSIAVREQLLHSFGNCIGSDVKVSRFAAQYEIPHTTTNQKGLMAIGAEGAANAVCKPVWRHRSSLYGRGVEFLPELVLFPAERTTELHFGEAEAVAQAVSGEG